MVFIGGVRRCCVQRLSVWGPLVGLAGHATCSGVQVSSLHQLWALESLSAASTRHVDKMVFGNAQTHGQPAKLMLAGRPHLGSVESVVCATSFPRVILSVIVPYCGHNEDIHGFWSIWCFFVI
jgi:hypothetical protein